MELHGEHGAAKNGSVELKLTPETSADIVRDNSYVTLFEAEYPARSPCM